MERILLLLWMGLPIEYAAVVKRINETKPDFVWVGLGAPKQEKWMAAHQGVIDGFMVGVGAGFDYFAGNIERAPEWIPFIILQSLEAIMKNQNIFMWICLDLR